MLRLILRHTHNALLVACILLLLCSFERLCRYDFNQIPRTSSPANIGEEGLQVDHFVFWGGIPAWERSLEAKNPVSVGLFKFMSWANSNSNNLRVPTVVAPATEAEEAMLFTTATPLSEANTVLRRQIRHNKKKHGHSKEDGSRKSASGDTSQQDSSATASSPQPKIGFLLHLPSCDREEIARWQKVWNEQALDQPFHFQILLGSTVEESCVAALESELQDTKNMIYQVTQNSHMAMGLQTCHHGSLLEQLDEFLYYDVSKATGRLRSSASIRRYQRTPKMQSSFQCVGQQQRLAFCDETILECPWFQYAPPGIQETQTELQLTTA